MATRADPFAEADDPIDVNDFELDARKARRKPVDADELASFAKATGFDRSIQSPAPVRGGPGVPTPLTAKQRRYRTGRDAQLNIKSKPETKAKFSALADRLELSQGELFEMMLDRFEKTDKVS